MGGPITFSGLGSGIDIEAIVSGLVGASSQNLNLANRKVSAASAATSALSGVGSLLSDLKTVVDSLDSATELASYSGKSSDEDAAVVTTTGEATPASYTVSDVILAKEQRTYSGSQTSRDTDLTQTGTLRLTQGGTDYDITIDATDSLEGIGAKINGLKAGISASIFYDGTNYRLQLRSKETGSDEAFVVQELGGFNIGLSDVAATVQDAGNASAKLDGFTVTSSTNTISGAIEGVNIELKKEGTTPFSISIEADTDSMKASLDEFVSKYNSVITRIHSISGFGGSEGTSAALRGDGSLRSITNRLASTMLTSAGTGGNLETLADLGIRLNNDGTLKIDSDRMESALVDNPEGFSKVLAGDSTSDGLMDIMGSLLKSFTDIGTGTISLRKDALSAEIKLFQGTAEREQKRLDAMEIRLRRTFSAMDADMGMRNIEMSFLASI